MYTCDQAFDALSLGLDEPLTEAEQQQLDHHLLHCPSCRQVAQDLLAIQEAMPEDVDLPSGLHQSIMEAVLSEPRLVVLPKPKKIFWQGWTALAAAFGLVVGLGLMGGYAHNSGVSTIADTAPSTEMAVAEPESAMPSTAGMAVDPQAAPSVYQESHCRQQSQAMIPPPEDTSSGLGSAPELYNSDQEIPPQEVEEEMDSDQTIPAEEDNSIQEEAWALAAQSGYSWLSTSDVWADLDGSYTVEELTQTRLTLMSDLAATTEALDAGDWIITYYNGALEPVVQLVLDSKTSQVLAILPVN